MNWSRLQWRRVAGFGVLLLLGVILTLLVYIQVSGIYSAREWVTHSRTVLAHIDRMTDRLSAAEASQRGYLLTGGESHLARFNEAAAAAQDPASILQTLNQLKGLTGDNPEQQDRLRIIEGQLNEKIGHMADTVSQWRPAATPALIARMNAEAEMMQGLRAAIGGLRTVEENLLAARRARSLYQSDTNVAITFTLAGVLTVVILAAHSLIQQEFNRRLRVERSLREAASFQRALLDSTLYSVIAMDSMGVIRLFNPAAERMLGYRAEELIGRQTPLVFHDPDEIQARARELSLEFGEKIEPGFDVHVKKAVVNGSDEREWTYVRQDGGTVPVQLAVTPIYDDHGQISGYVGIAKDISERRHVDRLKNEFVSTVSHELRTPLTSIRGALGLIAGNMSSGFSERAQHLVGIAHKNSERLVRLINNILDLEKIDSGGLMFERRPLMVEALLKQSAEEIQAFAEKYRVRIVMPPLPPGLMVHGDADRLVQVFVNLLSNAVKYSPPNAEVTLSASATLAGVRISVEDNGPGVPEGFKARIFQKFAQADSSDTRQKGGSGLGLSISRAIMESLRGTLSFESKPGLTRFSATLPRSREDAGEAPAIYPVSAGKRRHGRILVCEKNADIALMLGMILEQEGFPCVFARTALEAKQRLEKENFLAMTLDPELPDQDGFSLIRELRQTSPAIRLPIILVATNAENCDVEFTGEAIGVLGWLPKPVDAKRLKLILRQLPGGDGKPRILHVEDEADISRVLDAGLHGLARLTAATTLAEARRQLQHDRFDLAVLDLRLPDGTGLDLLPELAARGLPVIILSVNETSQDVQRQVVASLVKSVASEEKIIATIKSSIGVTWEKAS